MDPAVWEWTCACCGRTRRGIPDIAFEGPTAWLVRDRDPEVRVLAKTDEHCEVEIAAGRFTYIRCVLALPLAFLPGEVFGFGVWSTLSPANARRYLDTLRDDDQAALGTMFGYLGSRLPEYPDTENLFLDVVPRHGRQRPLVRVQARHADHPLWRDQCEGIGEERLAALLSRAMPCQGRA